MTRLELREKFRAENPELTERAISDSILNAWLLTANDEVACLTRCIVSEESEIIDSEVGVRGYDLEDLIDNFYAIDDFPGGGVYYDDVPLIKTTLGEMNRIRRSWKTDANGTPKRWWRRGKMLYLDRPPVDSDVEIAVDVIYRADAFDGDGQQPFNGLGHLQPFSDALSKYLQWRAKGKVGKPDEASIALNDYNMYITWMKKEVGGAKTQSINIQPKR